MLQNYYPDLMHVFIMLWALFSSLLARNPFLWENKWMDAHFCGWIRKNSLPITGSGVFCPCIFCLSMNSAVMTAFPCSHMPSAVSGIIPELVNGIVNRYLNELFWVLPASNRMFLRACIVSNVFNKPSFMQCSLWQSSTQVLMYLNTRRANLIDTYLNCTKTFCTLCVLAITNINWIYLFIFHAKAVNSCFK